MLIIKVNLTILHLELLICNMRQTWIVFTLHWTDFPVWCCLLLCVPCTNMTHAPEIVPIQSRHSVCCLPSIHLPYPPPHAPLLSALSQIATRNKSYCVSAFLVLLARIQYPVSYHSISSSTSTNCNLIMCVITWDGKYIWKTVSFLCIQGGKLHRFESVVDFLYRFSDMVIT